MIYAEIYFACVSLMGFIVCIFSSCFFIFYLTAFRDSERGKLIYPFVTCILPG